MWQKLLAPVDGVDAADQSVGCGFWHLPDDAIDRAFTTLRREEPVSVQAEVALRPVIEQGSGY
jgi:hypothetical protein